MKRTTKSLLLIFSASLLFIPCITAEEGSESKEEQAARHQIECSVAVHTKILNQLNPESSVRITDRFSRVLKPMPETYYDMQLVDQDAAGETIEFVIVYIDRQAQIFDPKNIIVAKGHYNTKGKQLFLIDKDTQKPVEAAEHPIVKNPQSAKPVIP